MKEYKERFIWNKLINKLKEDFTEKISKNLNEMIIDSSDGEDINRNNNSKGVWLTGHTPLFLHTPL